jgi:hypothetical protein
VAALYSTRRTLWSEDPSAGMTERSRFTNNESSLSTRMALRATEARRASGKGMSSVLCGVKGVVSGIDHERIRLCIAWP